MAHIELDGMDDLLKKLEKLSDVNKLNDIAIKAVTEAQPISEAAMRAAIASVEQGRYATGSVSNSIESTPTLMNGYGIYAVARPTGRDAKGVRNGAKAAYLQYGTSRLQPRPWRQRAILAAQQPCIKAMEDVLKAEMELE